MSKVLISIHFKEFLSSFHFRCMEKRSSDTLSEKERHACRFGTTQGWVNDDRMFLFWLIYCFNADLCNFRLLFSSSSWKKCSVFPCKGPWVQRNNCAESQRCRTSPSFCDAELNPRAGVWTINPTIYGVHSPRWASDNAADPSAGRTYS